MHNPPSSLLNTRGPIVLRQGTNSPLVSDANADVAFGKVFARLHMNRALDSYDRDLYSVLYMLAWPGGCTSSVTQEALAAYLGISRRQIRRCVKHLETEREISVTRSKDASNTYKIVHFFSQSKEREASPAGSSKMSLCACCLKPRKGLSRAGICRGCVAVSMLPIRLAEARAELGPSASPESVIMYAKLSPRYRSAARRILEQSA